MPITHAAGHVKSNFGEAIVVIVGVEAVRSAKDRGVAVAQASRDLDLYENVLRKWSGSSLPNDTIPFRSWADEA